MNIFLSNFKYFSKILPLRQIVHGIKVLRERHSSDTSFTTKFCGLHKPVTLAAVIKKIHGGVSVAREFCLNMGYIFHCKIHSLSRKLVQPISNFYKIKFKLPLKSQEQINR